MYGQCDDEDENSLNSSFWSDDGREEEEEEEIERTVGKEAEELLLEASEEEKSEEKESKVTDGGSGGAEGDDEGSRSSSGRSSTTSGSGTCRAEDQGADASTADRVDRDRRGDPSELRADEEERRSGCSHFWLEEAAVALPQSPAPEPAGPGAAGGGGAVTLSDSRCGDGGGVLDRFTAAEKAGEAGRVHAARERPEEEQELQEADRRLSEQDHSSLDSRSNCPRLRAPPGASAGASAGAGRTLSGSSAHADGGSSVQVVPAAWRSGWRSSACRRRPGPAW